jgi:hypothetical protein
VGNPITAEFSKDGLDSFVMSYALLSQTNKVIKFVGCIGHELKG